MLRKEHEKVSMMLNVMVGEGVDVSVCLPYQPKERWSTACQEIMFKEIFKDSKLFRRYIRFPSIRVRQMPLERCIALHISAVIALM